MKLRGWMIGLIYCVPWVYLAVRADAVHGTVMLYAVMALAFLLLSKAAVKAGGMPVILVGNLLSCMTSWLCMAMIGPQGMGAYFKPFTGSTLTLTISVVAAAAQLLFVRRMLRKGKAE